MHEISDILKRSKISNILSYLIYASGENETMVESYDNAIDESYETFFNDIESLYTDAHREDNELFDIISEFACVHDDIYFEAGMLVGFHLYKELTEFKKPGKLDVALHPKSDCHIVSFKAIFYILFLYG